MNIFTKATLITSVLIVAISFAGCKKENGCTDPAASNYNPNANVDNGTCQYATGVVFYPDEPLPNNATVTMSGFNPSTATITSGTYATAAPNCNSTGLANFSTVFSQATTQQSYSYTVALGGTPGWSGTVTLSQGLCSTVLLPTCLVTFYTTNSGYGPISVTINNYASTISGAVNNPPSVSPANNCANFAYPAGYSISYTAATTQNNSGSWNGTIPAPSDGQSIFVALN
jgi:hypothetical protein